RCNASPDKQFLLGNPELTRHLVNLLAADENILTLEEALRRLVDVRMPVGKLRDAISNWSLAAVQATDSTALLGDKYGYKFDQSWNKQGWRRLLRHEPVILCMAVGRLTDELRSTAQCRYLEFCFPREFIREVAIRI